MNTLVFTELHGCGVVDQHQNEVVVRGNTGEPPVGGLVDAVKVAEDQYQVIVMGQSGDALENLIETPGFNSTWRSAWSAAFRSAVASSRA